MYRLQSDMMADGSKPMVFEDSRYTAVYLVTQYDFWVVVIKVFAKREL